MGVEKSAPYILFSRRNKIKKADKNKNKENKVITNIDLFDDEVSLYNMIPCGDGKAVAVLKNIVDAYTNDIYSRYVNKIPSILIYGHEGTALHAKAFANALGLYYKTTEARFLDNSHRLEGFFRSDSADCYILKSIEDGFRYSLDNYVDIVTNGKFQIRDIQSSIWRYIHVNGFVIFVAKDISKVDLLLLKKIDYKIPLEKYNTNQIHLILVQRLKYCSINFKTESVITKIVESCNNSVTNAMRILRYAIMIMRADNRTTLMITDIEKTLRFLKQDL